MSDFEFHLFRIKFIRPKQISFLHDSKSPADVFREALSEKPDGEFREDYIWHIGNVKDIDSDGGIFAIGRTTKTTVSKYDQESGDFKEELFEDSPYTVCLYDLNIGFVAIAKKSRRSPTTTGIAGKLKKLIDTTKIVSNGDKVPEPMAFSQSNYGVIPRIDNCFFFTYLLINHVVGDLQSSAYGSVFDTITTNTFRDVKIGIPPEIIVRKFEGAVSPYFDKILQNKNQIRTLGKLRDTLLPKLVSGEVRVKI